MQVLSILDVCLVLSTVGFPIVQSDNGYKNWNYHFPTGSGMGFFLAVALPLQLPSKSAYLAYNFEANYALPGNETDVEYPPVIGRKSRGIDRKMVYDIIEAKINSYGLNGKNCMLRTICEASLHTFDNNGVLGDLFHILLTPSTSKNDVDFSDDYTRAERAGRARNCKKYYKKCKRSIISLISWIGQIL